MNAIALKKACKYLDIWLETKRRDVRTPGLTVAISHRGKIVYDKAFGFANLAKNEKMTPDRIFRVASHSKMFTATSILMLQEQGRIQIDEPVVKYATWLAKHDDKRWQNVTLRQLLSHSAGVIRDGQDSDYWQLLRPFPNREQFKKELLAADLVVDNNTEMKYSNFGFTLLGLVVEEVSGQTYNDFVRKNIVEVLGLRNTGPDLNDEIVGKLTTGYTREFGDGKRIPIEPIDTHAMSAATGFCSTAADLCVFANALMVGSGKLLSDETKKEMQREQWKVKNSTVKEAYGLGIDHETICEKRFIGHSGGFPGNITRTIFNADDELAIVVLTNCTGGPAGSLAAGAYSIIKWFDDNFAKEPKRDLGRFDGHFATLWGENVVASSGDRIVSTSPNEWRPFDSAETLEYVDENTLRIEKCNGYASRGELIKYDFDGDKVRKIVDSGTTMIPAADYDREMSAKEIIAVKD